MVHEAANEAGGDGKSAAEEESEFSRRRRG
jgi:hypothetical protein